MGTIKTAIEIVGNFQVLFSTDEEGKTCVRYFRVFASNPLTIDYYRIIIYEVGDLISMGIDNEVRGYKLVGGQQDDLTITYEEIEPVFDFVQQYAKDHGLHLWTY